VQPNAHIAYVVDEEHVLRAIRGIDDSVAEVVLTAFAQYRAGVNVYDHVAATLVTVSRYQTAVTNYQVNYRRVLLTLQEYVRRVNIAGMQHHVDVAEDHRRRLTCDVGAGERDAGTVILATYEVVHHVVKHTGRKGFDARNLHFTDTIMAEYAVHRDLLLQQLLGAISVTTHHPA
jgi:hypothetical protein